MVHTYINQCSYHSFTPSSRFDNVTHILTEDYRVHIWELDCDTYYITNLYFVLLFLFLFHCVRLLVKVSSVSSMLNFVFIFCVEQWTRGWVHDLGSRSLAETCLSHFENSLSTNNPQCST